MRSTSAAQNQHTTPKWKLLRCLGKVFEKPGTPWAYKVLLFDRSDKLWNNYLMHMRVQESFDKLGILSGGITILRVAWYLLVRRLVRRRVLNSRVLV